MQQIEVALQDIFMQQSNINGQFICLLQIGNDSPIYLDAGNLGNLLGQAQGQGPETDPYLHDMVFFGELSLGNDSKSGRSVFEEILASLFRWGQAVTGQNISGVGSHGMDSGEYLLLPSFS